MAQTDLRRCPHLVANGGKAEWQGSSFRYPVHQANVYVGGYRADGDRNERSLWVQLEGTIWGNIGSGFSNAT